MRDTAHPLEKRNRRKADAISALHAQRWTMWDAAIKTAALYADRKVTSPFTDATPLNGCIHRLPASRILRSARRRDRTRFVSSHRRRTIAATAVATAGLTPLGGAFANRRAVHASLGTVASRARPGGSLAERNRLATRPASSMPLSNVLRERKGASRRL